MLDPTSDMLPPPSSPTNSSVSSSDLDTESTGSFFHDRSTTLGTLMGVTFPAITFRAPSQHRNPGASSAVTAPVSGGNPMRRADRRRNPASSVLAERWRGRWWGLCRDGGGAKPASLGEFLEVERRFGDTAAELEGAMVPRSGGGVNGRLLFADGRVLPPADAVDDGGLASTAGANWRFPVSLTGICSGCTG